ncbi:hypothetical protein ACFC1W_07800 [Microbacterium sp. NPDC056003]|uniref:hypothetical protein n=1 Tax=Microbacterium sp. NPDC056003 TaxID=3345676 RepID=UPI0035E32C12
MDILVDDAAGGLVSDPGISGLSDLLAIGLVVAAAIAGLIAMLRRSRTTNQAGETRPRADDGARQQDQRPRQAPNDAVPPSARAATQATASSPPVDVSPAAPTHEAPLPNPQSRVVTRTTPGVRVDVDQVWPGNERPWTPSEDAALLVAYDRAARSGTVVMPALARAVGIDQLQVARRLIRFTLTPRGDLDDATDAVNDGARYSAATRNELLSLHDLGLDLPVVASRSGRTQLAAGWQIVERRHPPIRADVRSRIGRGLAGMSEVALLAQLSPVRANAPGGSREVAAPGVTSDQRRANPELRHSSASRAPAVCPNCFQVRSVSGACGCD